MKKYYLLFSTFLIFIPTITRPFTWRNLDVRSQSQSVLSDNRIACIGDVHASLDDLLHLQAPSVYYNTESNQVWATGDAQQPVLLQHDEITLLADSVHLNAVTQTGEVRNARVHAKEGLVQVARMNRTADGVWHLHNIMYTGCHHANPHWSFTARKAHITNNRLYAQGVAWRWGKQPLLYLPIAQLPLHRASGTGLLIPKLSYDREQGFGMHQELFLSLNDEADMTIGANWRSRRGAVWSHELRTALGKQGRLQVNTWYGSDRKGSLDRFTGQLRRDSDYWVRVRSHYQLPWQNVRYVTTIHVQADYGSDQRVREHFFTAPSDRDTWHANTVDMRCQAENTLLQAGLHNDIWQRNQFVPTVKTRRTTEGEEEYEGRRLYYLPHVQWHTGWVGPGMCRDDVSGAQHDRSAVSPGLIRGPAFAYRHSCFADLVLLRSAAHTIVYDTVASSHLKNATTVWGGRAGYHGEFCGWLPTQAGIFAASVQPQLQARSAHDSTVIPDFTTVIPAQAGTQRDIIAYNRYEVAYASPPQTYVQQTTQSVVTSQLLAAYRYQPRRQPQNWYLIDEHEAPYELHDITIGGEVVWQRKAITGLCRVRQPWYLGRGKDLIRTQRSRLLGTGMPLELQGEVRGNNWYARGQHTFNWYENAFVFHQLRGGVQLKGGEYELGITHYDQRHAAARQLLFPGGTFLSGAARWRVNAMQVWYEADWLFKKGAENGRALQQAIGLQYEGHCWSWRAGYEEKRYVHYGRRKKQRALFCMFTFRPLGALGTKIKQWVTE
ncbi:MAG: hypothetical protein PVJ92_00375 [Candidatus Dependentiae bacterium]|jgi:hypothetical protein